MGFILLFPLVLGELIKPFRYEFPTDVGGLGLFLLLSVGFLTLAIVYLRTMQVGPAPVPDPDR